MEPPPHSPRACWISAAALILLAGSSFALSHAALGGWGTAVALGIATAKALIIALVFIGLGRQPGSNRLVLMTAAALILVLTGFTAADVMTR
jgi:cytochrome c oxidase subunit 4